MIRKHAVRGPLPRVLALAAAAALGAAAVARTQDYGVIPNMSRTRAFIGARVIDGTDRPPIQNAVGGWFSDDGRTIAVITSDNHVVFLDGATGRPFGPAVPSGAGGPGVNLGGNHFLVLPIRIQAETSARLF